jgi:colanic acid/amylovoran biosynthesis glycosyltransferase
MTQPQQATGPELLVLPSVACRVEGDEVLLDKKFASGMALYARLWDGPVRCLMRDDASDTPFADRFHKAALPFAVDTLSPAAPILDEHLAGSTVVLAGGDDHRQHGVAELCRRAGIACVYGVEYTLETRLRVLWAERPGPVRLLKSSVWAVLDERRRRRTFRAARAIQANGAPAFRAYASPERGDLLYFDNRMTTDMFATEAHLARLAARLNRGEPLRLLYSGRLERLKGADQLLSVMRWLRDWGVPATLDIYGTGALLPAMMLTVADDGLEATVRFHAPLDFETGLVPAIKGRYDIFVCCHPQPDPSCTYIETLACGIPIAGYRNRAFAGLLQAGELGWGTPVGRPRAMAACIAQLAGNRDAIAARAASGLAFARQHDFETVFRRRVDHLRRQMSEAETAEARSLLSAEPLPA